MQNLAHTGCLKHCLDATCTYTIPEVYKACPLGDGEPGSQSHRLSNALKSPAWSHTLEELSLLVLLYSVASYGQQSCGSILWPHSNASPAHWRHSNLFQLSGHSNPSCVSCKNVPSSVPHFVLCSSNAPATCGADLTAWSNDVLAHTVLSHIAAYTLQPRNSASVLPSMIHIIFLRRSYLFFCKILSNLR